jgi:Rrf2 family protein
MKLSTRVQYGIRMLSQLALEYNSGPLQMGEIGEREGISTKYLGQIMLLLRSSGLVLAVRGSQGGYYLSRPPHDIRLREVFEVLDGEVLGVDEGEDKAGQNDMRLAANELWTRLRAGLNDVLDSLTLADLVSMELQKKGYGEYSI